MQELEMFYLLAGLIGVGALCGAILRFMIFAFVLLGAAVIAVAAKHDLGDGLLLAIVTVSALQVGYAAGMVIRAKIATPLGKKRHIREVEAAAEDKPAPAVAPPARRKKAS
jgi:hypothetical protein